jgi:hypothetical protein
VLWRRRQVSGVVDVAHCRSNLLAFDRSVADRFTAIWSKASGADFHPWADVVTIDGCLDDLRSSWGSERDLIEEVLADAVAQLDQGP